MILGGFYPRQPVSLCLRKKNSRVPSKKTAWTGGLKVCRRELPNQMRTRIFRPIATLISLVLLLAVPAQASPIQFHDIVNVMGDLQRGGRIDRLRLRVAQDPSVPQ